MSKQAMPGQDLRLKRALDHAPDTVLTPSAQSRQAILMASRTAVAPLQRRFWLQRLWPVVVKPQSFAAWNALAASVCVFLFVGLIWRQNTPESIQQKLPPAESQVAHLPPPSDPISATKQARAVNPKLEANSESTSPKDISKSVQQKAVRKPQLQKKDDDTPPSVLAETPLTHDKQAPVSVPAASPPPVLAADAATEQSRLHSPSASAPAVARSMETSRARESSTRESSARESKQAARIDNVKWRQLSELLSKFREEPNRLQLSEQAASLLLSRTFVSPDGVRQTWRLSASRLSITMANGNVLSYELSPEQVSQVSDLLRDVSP